METVGELNKRLRERASGRLFGRWARATALATLKGRDVGEIASEHRWVEAEILKTAVTADRTGTSEISYALAQSLAEIEGHYSAVRQLQAGFRSVPPNTSIVSTTAGASAAWISEGAAVPASRQSSSTRTTLQPLRLSALSVVTEELAMLSASEQIITTDHARARADELDRAFFDFTNAGSPEESPISIAYNARQFASSGNSVSAVDSDLLLLINELSAGGSNLRNAAFVLNPTGAAYLASLRGSGGAPAYPGIGVNGGTLIGLPAICSQGLELTGSPNESYIVLVDPSRIWWTEGTPSFSTSRTAAIEMTDAPTNDAAVGTGANLVSMWQTHSMAIISSTRANWKTVDDTSAAVVLTGCNF